MTRRTLVDLKNKSLSPRERDIVDSTFPAATLIFESTGEAQDAEIQASIDRSSSNNVHLFRPGTFKFNKALTLKSDLKIVGHDTLFDFSGAAPTANGLEFSGAALDNVTIEGIQIRGGSQDTGDADDTQANGIYINTTGAGTRIKIHNVHSERWRQGIYVVAATTGTCEAPEAVDCNVEECARSGIRMQNVQRALIDGNVINGIRTVGDTTDTDVNIWLPTTTTGDESTFCRIIDNATRGGALESIILQTKHSICKGNTIDDPGTAGIVVETANDATTKEHGKLYNVVTGNTISGTSADGIKVIHDPANNVVGAGYNIVSHNNIFGTGRCIRIGQTGASAIPCFDNTVSYNVCIDATTSTGAIEVFDSEGTSLEGNRSIGSTGAGIKITGSSKRTIVNGGYLVAPGTPGDAVLIDSTASGVLIAGVMFANCARYGVNTASTPSNICITGNYFLDDQGSPTFFRAVNIAAGVVNAQVWANYSVNTTAADPVTGTLADPQVIQVGDIEIFAGSGTPESSVTAGIGALFMRTDGGASTSLYIKESGTGNTGWVAK